MNKTMDKFKVAIIGCGRISRMYKQSFKSLSSEVSVKYAVDTKRERAEQFAEEFKGCQVETDYRNCFQDDLDVVHIATPHYLHAEMAINAMNNGINVLTEKPISIELEKADEMIETAENNSVKLGVIFQTRYVKGCLELKELIKKGKLGKITAARSYLSWWRTDDYYDKSDWKGTWDKEGGGVLIDQAIHSIDRVQWLVGDDIDWIKGSMDNRAHEKVDVEDVAEGFIKFKNGCLYQLYACNCYSYNAPIEIEITGEKGKVGLKKDLAWVDLDGKEYYEIKDQNDGLSSGEDYWGSSHSKQIKDFYDSIRNDSPVYINGREGKKSLQIVHGIYESSEKEQRIVFN